MKSLLTIIALAASLSVPGLGQVSGRSATLRGIANRGYLGVGIADLTDDRVKALNLKDDQGVEVKHVDENSPALKAGLKENDVILEVNGKTVEGVQQFGNAIGDMSPGTKVNLTVWRSGAKQTLSATLDARPFFALFGVPAYPNAPIPPMPQVPLGGVAPFPTIPTNSPIVGFEGETLNSQLAAYFGVKEGVLVRSVNAETPASRAGLKAGDVVVKVNDTPVTSPREISGLVRANRRKDISFTVVRNRKQITLSVEIAEDRSGAADRQVL